VCVCRPNRIFEVVESHRRLYYIVSIFLFGRPRGSPTHLSVSVEVEGRGIFHALHTVDRNRTSALSLTHTLLYHSGYDMLCI
jgi:hypothetical protein